MDARQLKLLGARVRELVAEWDIGISHGQALDLVAALPGLRDWPEVIAFPDRVAARDIDLEAMSRLGRRIGTKFGQLLSPRITSRLDAVHLMDRLNPWTIVEPRGATQRERLIVTCGDSASGGVRAAGSADRVERTSQQLVWGPVPLRKDPVEFLAARFAAWDSDFGTTDQPEDWERDAILPKVARHKSWEHHLAAFQEYDRIELWIDPQPNAQLQLLQLLDWLGRQDALAEKVFLMQADDPIGGCGPFGIRSLRARAEKVRQRQFELAARAWGSFCEPTPQSWFDLLSLDLGALPRLRATVRGLLAELPATITGLRATERRLLERLANGGATWMNIFPNMLRFDEVRVYGYWELGRLLDGLARGPRSAITGLPDGPFDMALHDDQARLKNYQASELQLSPLGKALLRSEEDIVRNRAVRFWWGGTKVTHTSLWRWDEATSTLSLSHAP
jgi:hypothetical protein